MSNSILAGGLQLYSNRLVASEGTINQTVGYTNMTTVEGVHILWTIPQFIFLGISEVFVGLTG